LHCRLHGNAEAVQKYKTYRNKLTHIKELAKISYYKKIISESQHNTKLLWKTINDIAKYKMKTKSHITELVDENGHKTIDPSEMAKLFNNYFSEIGSKMSADINKPESDNISYISYIAQTPHSLYLKPISVTDILRHLNQLNPKKVQDYTVYP